MPIPNGTSNAKSCELERLLSSGCLNDTGRNGTLGKRMPPIGGVAVYCPFLAWGRERRR